MEGIGQLVIADFPTLGKLRNRFAVDIINQSFINLIQAHDVRVCIGDVWVELTGVVADNDIQSIWGYGFREGGTGS